MHWLVVLYQVLLEFAVGDGGGRTMKRRMDVFLSVIVFAEGRRVYWNI